MKKRRFIVGVGLVVLLGGFYGISILLKEPKVGVSLIGVHHLARNFRVDEFYVDDYPGGRAGYKGSGISFLCCVMLPLKWRPGLSADVRWKVTDWNSVDEQSIGQSDYSRIKVRGIYRAKVEIERYQEVGDLYVHFFDGGKVRVVSSNFIPRSELHPIHFDDRAAVQSATAGTSLPELFSEVELAANFKRSLEEGERGRQWR